MAMGVEITSWDMMWCSLIDTTNILAKPAASTFRLEKTQHVQAAGYPETLVPSTKLHDSTFQKINAFIDLTLARVLMH